MATLGAGDLKEAVKLPANRTFEEWAAAHVSEFFNQLNLLFSSIIDNCTTESCPEMTAGPAYKYYWQDNDKYKKPTMIPAREYIANVLLMVEKYLDDESVFPSDPATPYPKNFREILVNIFKRMFRIYAHIYFHHREHIQRIGAEAHLNTCFRHFVIFAKEFKLIPEDQYAPLKQIIDKF
ncbi:MOB kinase activator-like 1A [Histomonas meleagridis]|uniref:MOB kinase activator-like 1A n=1 Tax=Histomonas meleagridis TaxID=135588 RepID=UPI003559A345|nr:MOB kinase activator-like 1A [Histomonas meleagridis]KAH0799937.1 MOB kinase activator-like 1A [Histomonas meleagridis]